MKITKLRIIILFTIGILAFVLGRLAVRAILNLLMGGTLLGGNFLWSQHKRKRKAEE